MLDKTGETGPGGRGDGRKPSDVSITLVNYTSAAEGYEDFSYAVLSITLKYALWLLKQIGIAAVFKGQSESFHRVSYFHVGPEYYHSWATSIEDSDQVTEEAFQELESEVDNCGWVEMPACWKPHGDATRTDCDMLCVDESTVIFTCYPKHARQPTEIETQVLTQEMLAGFANQLMQMQAEESARTSKRVPREHRVVQLDKGGS